jgi:protein-S-isoprenylcysteine O-methyltransferase Ste14
MRPKIYSIVLLFVPILFLMAVGLKTLLGWWTGDWKSPLLTATLIGIAIICMFEQRMRTLERDMVDPVHTKEDKVL